MTERKVIFMLVYDIYFMEHGKNYYQYFHLRGSEEWFEYIKAILATYAEMHIIDDYYMFELSPEDKEGAKDA